MTIGGKRKHSKRHHSKKATTQKSKRRASKRSKSKRAKSKRAKSKRRNSRRIRGGQNIKNKSESELEKSIATWTQRIIQLQGRLRTEKDQEVRDTILDLITTDGNNIKEASERLQKLRIKASAPTAPVRKAPVPIAPARKANLGTPGKAPARKAPAPIAPPRPLPAQQRHVSVQQPQQHFNMNYNINGNNINISKNQQGLLIVTNNGENIGNVENGKQKTFKIGHSTITIDARTTPPNVEVNYNF